MGALTEPEIFACMAESLRQAIGHAQELAERPAQGPAYSALRRELKLIEGCCRQAAYWREDARWLQPGMMMQECHRRAGNWLRARAPRTLFTKLADNLRLLLRVTDDLRDKAPPKLGLILPEPLKDPTQRNAQILLPTMPDTMPKPGGALRATTALSKVRLAMPKGGVIH